jgi:hypothetical protein
LLRSKIAETYDPVLAEEVPERLVRLFDPPRPRVLAFRRPNLASAGWRWQHLSAMAASLALALFLGYSLSTAGDPAEQEAGYRIAGATAEALDVQLASAQSPTAPVQICVSRAAPLSCPKALALPADQPPSGSCGCLLQARPRLAPSTRRRAALRPR